MVFFLKKLSKLFYLLFLLILALAIDLLIYATTAGCVSCASFGQFLWSTQSLTGPVIVSLIALFPSLTEMVKRPYNEK